MPMSSTGPSTAPNQCGVQVENSTASPANAAASVVRSLVEEGALARA